MGTTSSRNEYDSPEARQLRREIHELEERVYDGHQWQYMKKIQNLRSRYKHLYGMDCPKSRYGLMLCY